MVGEPDERVPNNHPDHAYPLFTPVVSVNFDEVGELRCDVDNSGTAHVVGTALLDNSRVLFYTSNKFETRAPRGTPEEPLPSSGFSTPFKVARNLSSPADPSIAVEPNGTVHVVWQEKVHEEDDVFSSIFYRKRGADGIWEDSKEILMGSVTRIGKKTERVDFSFPRIAVNSGIVNAACMKVTTTVFDIRGRRTGLTDIRESVYEIIYGADFAFDSIASINSAEGGRFSSLGKLQILKGEVYTSWLKHDTLGIGQEITVQFYKNGAIIDLISSVNAVLDTNTFVFSVGVGDTEDSRVVHTAFMSKEGEVLYGELGGTLEIPTDIDDNSLTNFPVELLIDSRKQPIILTLSGIMAKLVKKADGQKVWGFRTVRRHPLALGGVGSAVIENDFLHIVSLLVGDGDGLRKPGFGYTRTYEPNLGREDPDTMFDVGPAMHVNVANGNLFGVFPLFSSKGAGLATSIMLFYNSLESQTFTVGRGWSHNLDITLDGDELSGMLMRFGDGSHVQFSEEGVADSNFLLSKKGVTDINFDFMARILLNSPELGKTTVLTKFGMRYVFRPDGKIEKIVGTNDESIHCTYDADGRLLIVTDTMERETKFFYNTVGLLGSITDPAGIIYKLEYDNTPEGPTLTHIRRDPDGLDLTWEFLYSHNDDPETFEKKGMIKEVRTPRGNRELYGIKYEYYPDGRLRATLDPPEMMVLDDDKINAEPTLVSDARSIITYSDSFPPFTGSSICASAEMPDLKFPPPLVIVQNRRENTTLVEYSYVRNIATCIRDQKGFFSEQKFGEYRTLVLSKDERGKETQYTYSSGYPANLKSLLTADAKNPISYEYSSDDASNGNDDLNRITAITDIHNNRTEFVYDSDGNLLEIKHPETELVDGSVEHAVETYAYTSLGRIKTQTDAEGGVTTCEYDDPKTGLITEILLDGQEKGNGERFTYDEMGNALTHTLPPNNIGSKTTTFFLDRLYRVVKEVDPFGNEKINEYDENSQIKMHRNRKGIGTFFNHDKRHQLGSVLSPAGNTSFWYDREEQSRRFTDRRGFTSNNLNGELGRITMERHQGFGTSIKPPRGGGPLAHVTEVEYDPTGNVKAVKSFKDRAVHYEYDARNNPIRVLYPQGVREEMIYDDSDNLLAVHRFEDTTFRGGIAYEYDERNRVRKIINLEEPFVLGNEPRGPTYSILYDKNSNPRKVWNANGSPGEGIANSAEYVYDSRQRLHQTKDGFGIVRTEIEYYEDNSPKLIRSQKPREGGLITVRQFSYTLRGEVMEETDALGNKTSFKYDLNGNLVSKTDPLGNVVLYVYDSADRLIMERYYPFTLNIVIRYGYDDNSNVTSIRVFNPASGVNDAIYNFVYDRANRLEKIVYPDPEHLEVWTYNEHGEVVTHRDANEKVQTSEYDLLGRVVKEVHGSPFAVTITRKFDGASNLVKISDGLTTIDYEYDTLNRLRSVSWDMTGGVRKKITYEYYPSGDRKKMIDPEGALFEYVYDDDNRLESIRRNLQTFVAFDYDEGARVKKMTLKNGAFVEYEYTVRDEVAKLVIKNSSNELLVDYSYQYDARGYRIGVKRELGEQVTYVYDDAGRLTTEASTGGFVQQKIAIIPSRILAWKYDKAGNRIEQIANGKKTTYEYDKENRLLYQNTPEGQVSYSYDNNGNLAGRSRPFAGIVETFGYDYANRLVRFARNVNLTDKVNFSYAYAPTGHRLNKADLMNSTKEWYMYDGVNVVADYIQEADGTIKTQTSYVNALSIDSKVARISVNGTEHFYITDALGSMIHFLDSVQSIVQDEVTDAWGNILASRKSVDDRYGFTQRERDSESGMIYFRNRSYDPELGRFIQKDPIIGNRPIEHYSYVSNNPTNSADPNGLQEESTQSSIGEAEKGEIAFLEKRMKDISAWEWVAYTLTFGLYDQPLEDWADYHVRIWELEGTQDQKRKILQDNAFLVAVAQTVTDQSFVNTLHHVVRGKDLVTGERIGIGARLFEGALLAFGTGMSIRTVVKEAKNLRGSLSFNKNYGIGPPVTRARLRSFEATAAAGGYAEIIHPQPIKFELTQSGQIEMRGITPALFEEVPQMTPGSFPPGYRSFSSEPLSRMKRAEHVFERMEERMGTDYTQNLQAFKNLREDILTGAVKGVLDVEKHGSIGWIFQARAHRTHVNFAVAVGIDGRIRTILPGKSGIVTAIEQGYDQWWSAFQRRKGYQRYLKNT